MSSANGRIVKNTGLLYFRLIFLTFINLYAVRVTFDALGDVDYGIFNVVASVVASLSILTGAMTSATQRFLSFHLGRNDHEEYSRTFSLLLMSFLVLSAFLIVIGEILGYFFIEKWLNIPVDRISAAYWVFQASLVAFVFGLVTIPYTSSIIANERMDAFALFSVVEGVMKLAIALWLVHFGGDRLILYGVLTAVTGICVFLMSMDFCHRKFRYCRYIWKWDRRIFMQLSGYTGWNLFGSVSGMLATQGQNILLNIYFGPVVNAAKAIADRIQHVVYGFSINLYMAVSPQIIKSYAAEDYQRAISLVVKTSRMSFLLLFVLAFPLICNMDGLLALWLGDGSRSPDMISFSSLILVYCMILSLEPPISRIIQATGKIRNYQLSVGVITLSFIPVAVVLLSLGCGAVTTLLVLMAIMSLAQIVRVVVAHRQVGLDYRLYFHEVILPIVRVMVVAVPLYMVFADYSVTSDVFVVLVRTVVAAVSALFMAGILGLSRNDRDMVRNIVMKKFRKN